MIKIPGERMGRNGIENGVAVEEELFDNIGQSYVAYSRREGEKNE